MVALSMIPSCPAPVGLIITGLVAPLAGNLLYIGLNDNVKRDVSGMRKVARVDGYPGVSQQSYDQCKNSNNGAKVTVTQTADSSKSGKKNYTLPFFPDIVHRLPHRRCHPRMHGPGCFVHQQWLSLLLRLCLPSVQQPGQH